MRRSTCLLLAAASVLAAAERPRYGGTLRIEMQAAPRTVEANRVLAGAVFETLTRLDERGRPQPCLALDWRSARGGARWHFRLRGGVKFHDGSPLTAAAIASSLSAWKVTEEPGGVLIEPDRPLPHLPRTLANLPIVLRGTGTGPFRLEQFEPGRRALLRANEEHWEGRPFLDQVQVEMGRTPAQQMLDLELGRADLVELTPGELRRATRARAKLWNSAPLVLLALAFERSVEDVRVREALALSIDRTAIQSVLLQKQGEVAGGLLPQWLSGYAFLFATAPGVARARQLAPAVALVAGYDASDPLARLVAERIAVNARDAGIKLLVSAQPGRVDLRLVRATIQPSDPLPSLAAALQLELPGSLESPEARYAAERAVIEEYRIVPLVHVPEMYASTGAVRTWQTPGLLKTGEWRLADLWVRPEHK